MCLRNPPSAIMTSLHRWVGVCRLSLLLLSLCAVQAHLHPPPIAPRYLKSWSISAKAAGGCICSAATRPSATVSSAFKKDGSSCLPARFFSQLFLSILCNLLGAEGWVTVGMGVTGSNYNKETFQSWFNHPAPLTIGGECRVVPLLEAKLNFACQTLVFITVCVPPVLLILLPDKPNIHAPRDTDVVLGSWSEIEELRPKSPPPGERDREFEERTIDTMVRQLEREAGPRATHHQQPAGPPPAAQLTGQAHGRPEMRMEDHESQPWVQNQAMPVESSSKVWQRLQYQPPESGEGALEADSGLVTSQNERERDDYRRGQDSVRGSRGRGRPFYPHGHERGQGRARPARWVQVVDTDFQPYESPEPSDAAVTFASHEGGARGRGWKPRGRGRGGPGQANLPGQHFHNGRARGGGRGGRGGGGQYMAEQHSDT